MNLIRKTEELRQYIAEALAEAKRIGGTTLEVVAKHAYNVTILLGKVHTWKDNGAKTFILSKDLVEAFQHTDVPLDLCPNDFKYPFDVFLIESESPMFVTKTPIGNRQVFSILYLSDTAVYRDHGRMLIKSDGTVTNELEWNKSLTAFYPGDGLGVENMMIHMKDSRQIIDAIEQPKVGFGLVPLDKGDAQNMVNIFYNTVMYINDPDRNRMETESTQTRKMKDGINKSKVSMGYILLKPPKSYVPLSSNTGRTIDKRFVVRGHWKMQSYGEKHSLRKSMWIKPYWKGDSLSEIINKPYRVIYY
jgi:hypothetical protein